MSNWAVGSSRRGTGILKEEAKLMAYLTSDGPENLRFSRQPASKPRSAPGQAILLGAPSASPSN